MKKTTKLISALGAIAFIALLVSAPYSIHAIGSDSVKGYEENEVLVGLDIYVNQSTSPFQASPLQLQGDLEEKGWQIQRYILLPSYADLSAWTILDPNAKFVIGGFGGEDLSLETNSMHASNQKSEIGLTAFTGREVDGVEQVNPNERVAEHDGNTVDVSWDYFNESTSITGMAQNFTVEDNDMRSGIHYEAGDSKTLDEYSKDLSEADGKTWYDTQNGSVVAFAFDNFEDLESAVITMDQETSTSSEQGEYAFNVIRSRIWMKSKELASKTQNSFLGLKTKVATTTTNVFKSIKNVPTSLAGIPNGAKHFFSKSIPSAFNNIGKVGFASVTKSILGRVGAILQILLLLLLVFAIYWYGIKKKKFKGRR